MKSNSVPASCPHCISALNDVIAEFVYFECASNFNIQTQTLDRSKQCLKREKVISSKMIEFLKKKTNKKNKPS